MWVDVTGCVFVYVTLLVCDSSLSSQTSLKRRDVWQRRQRQRQLQRARRRTQPQHQQALQSAKLQGWVVELDMPSPRQPTQSLYLEQQMQNLPLRP